MDVTKLTTSLLQAWWVQEGQAYPAGNARTQMGHEADLGIDSIKRVEYSVQLTKQHSWNVCINPNELTRS